MISVICQCVYTTLTICFPARGRWVLPPHSRCNFSPLRTDAISVLGIVQDVLLHKRFPCWCCPVSFQLVYNVMWRYGVLHNMLHLRSLTMSRVPTHITHDDVFNTQSCFHSCCKGKKEPLRFPLPGVIWIFKVQRHLRRVYLTRQDKCTAASKTTATLKGPFLPINKKSL